MLRLRTRSAIDTFLDPRLHLRKERIGRDAEQRVQACDQDVSFSARRQRTQINAEVF
jgi:hypothetical protein